MKNIISVDNYNSLKEVVNEYIDVFGENGLKELNIEMLTVMPMGQETMSAMLEFLLYIFTTIISLE